MAILLVGMGPMQQSRSIVKHWNGRLAPELNWRGSLMTIHSVFATWAIQTKRNSPALRLMSVLQNRSICCLVRLSIAADLRDTRARLLSEMCQRLDHTIICLVVDTRYGICRVSVDLPSRRYPVPCCLVMRPV